MGKFLDEYEELKFLGQGAFAKIYKVRHLELDYIRAIRVLSEAVADNDNDNKIYQSFIKECKTLLKLGNGGHPNIVRIYRPDRQKNHALVEMDYIDGCNLDDYLQEKRQFAPIDEIIRFVREIGSALAYCHVDCYEYQYDKNKEYEYKLESELKGQKFKIEEDPDNGKKDLITDLQRRELIREYGIVHNDLHSKNIMRKRYDGSYILLDFGLAIQDGKAVKSSSRRDGAVEYRAPEKSDNKSIISERSDIYSFGILMYEMLTGQVPFPYEREKYSSESHALHELELKHKKTPPPAIEPLRRAAFEAIYPEKTYEKDYPEWLEQVIMKCLEKEPEDRYANGKELFEEVEKHILSTQTKSEELAKLKEQNQELIDQLHSLENEKTDFENQMNSLARQVAKAKFDVEKAVKEVENLKTERDNFKSKNENLSQQVTVLSGEKEQATKRVNDLQIQVSVLSDKHEKAAKLADDLRIRLIKEEESNREVSMKLEDLRRERDDLKGDNEKLSKQAFNLSYNKEEAANNFLQNQLLEAEKNNKALSEKLNKILVEQDNTKSSHVKLLNQVIYVSDKNDEMIKLTDDLKIRLEEAEKNSKILSEELNKTIEERDDFRDKNKSLSEQVADLSNKNAEVSILLKQIEDRSQKPLTELWKVVTGITAFLAAAIKKLSINKQ